MRALRMLLVCALLGTTAVAVSITAPAGADNITVSGDTLRTGWDANEAGLAPSGVGASDFGQLFATKLDGQIYAQPIVAKQTVLAVTENDKVYGLDNVTGKIKWTRDVGPAWPASNVGCGDLVPNIGITSTPVYDPATGTAYFTAKVNDGPDGAHPHWYLHAIDITTGAERANFPTTIGGNPSNDPTNVFNPKTAGQRPGLLLLDGVVYAGFASHCDYGPYVGYVAGFDKTSGRQTTLWSTEAGSSNSGAGIWHAGGGLVSDGTGQIIVATGNGISPPPGPGKTPPSTLGESVIRLKVGGDGNLTATDFFSPVNNTNLDREDADLGSGGPMAIPDGYGTAEHPHLLVAGGKDGRMFLLDRDDFGGVGQGAGGTDGVLQVGGPYRGVWGHPAFYGGDGPSGGGYVYTVTNGGPMLAFKTGVAGDGKPALTRVGGTTSTFGYTSGSPMVTSTGTTAGSALVWVVYSDGPAGTGGQLRAYDAVPRDGVMSLRYSAPIGTATKFAKPATDGGRVYTGTRDGVLYGFGRPTTAAVSSPPTDFGNVPAGSGTATKDVTVTATRPVTVTGVSTAAPFTAGAVTLPVTLQTGQTLTVPVTFAPVVTGAQSGALSFATDVGNLAFDLHGAGTRPGLAGNPDKLGFGQVPTTGTMTQSVSITNTGSASTTITGATAPTGAFGAASLPATGTVLAPGASVSVPITFAPTAAGSVSSTLLVTSSTGNVSVPVSGTGIVGKPRMTIPATLDFGKVPVGSTATATFGIGNSGNTVLTLNKAAPPADPFGAPRPVAEGQQIVPGDSVTQLITFTPTTTGAVSGMYSITGNDGQGSQRVTITGTGTQTPAAGNVPAPASGGWTANGSATQTGPVTTLTPALARQAGSVVYPTPVATAGLKARFTARISSGTGADGMTFALLDAATAVPTAVGHPGGALGFGSLPGVAVALDTYKNGLTDPSYNFFGVATGSTGTGTNETLAYAATAPAASALKSGSHDVSVSVTATGLAVSVDGGAPLNVDVPVPARALLAFTAGTGGRTDVHTVSDVAIDTAGVSGPLVGLAGKCAEATDAVRLAACSGGSAQTWTLPGDRTLRNAGACLTATATSNYSAVVTSSCTGAASQTWTVGSRNSLVNAASGRCLRVRGSVPRNNTPLVLYRCRGTSDEVWTLPGGTTST